MSLKNLVGEDFCSFERFELPLYKRGLVWLGGQNNDTKSANSNGSGKSNIFKAIGWAAYGESIDGEDGDAVIREGAKCARTTLDLTEGWSVIRERRKASPRLFLRKDGEDVKASKGDLQERVNELLGMDFQAFRNTVLYGSRDTRRFTHPTTKDAERKDVLHSIVRSVVYKYAHEVVKGRNVELKRSMDGLDAEISRQRARMEEHDVARLQTRSAEWESERIARLNELRDEAKSLVDRATTMSKGAPDVSGLEARLAEMRASIEAASTAEEALAEQERETRSKEIDLRDLVSARKVAASEFEAVQERAKLLGGDRCPTCSGSLRKGEAHKHVKELKRLLAEKKELLERCRLAYERGNKACDAQAIKTHAARMKARELNAKIPSAEECDELSQKIALAKNVKERINELSEASKRKIADARRVRDEVNPYTEQIDTARARLDKAKEAIERDSAKMKVHAYERAHVEFWIRGFSPTGLPSFVLDSVMPFLTERSNKYLETLADGDITMSFSTQRELKSSKGEYRDEIDISWEIEGKTGYPPSDGQFKKMEIATNFALMDLVATREGAHMDLLLLDECLDGLDEEGRQRIVQLLHDLRTSRGTIFVISHAPDTSEVFERSLVVVKKGGISRLEVA